VTGTRLSRRAHQQVLGPAGKTPALVEHLRAEACAGTWRIVEAFSASGAPFELWLSWSGGDGVGQEARVTVGRATRLAVFASSLTARVANLSPSENRVCCVVTDGYCVSANQLEVRGVVGPDGVPVTVPIPPYATHVRLDSASTGVPPLLSLHDGAGEALARTSAPTGALPLGGAANVQVTAVPTTAFRVVFQLSI
jgi:hypothetical protein